MKNHSLEAKELLSTAEMFEIKAGDKKSANVEESCGVCTNCLACTSTCTACTSTALDVLKLPKL